MKDTTSKAIQLFTYLKELANLKAVHTKDVESYDEVLWFWQIPREKECACIVWREADNEKETGKISTSWLEVSKPRLKAPPEVPDDLEAWMKYEELGDSSISEPSLYEEITVDKNSTGDSDGETEIRRISEYPGILDLWVDYVEKQWRPWAEEDKRLHKVKDIYNRLFKIYQQQERFGEQYEVVIGMGLLDWNTPHSGAVKRHMLEIGAQLEFDRTKGMLTVREPMEADAPMLEYEMLETDDRPEVNDLQAIQKMVKEINGDIWCRTKTDSVFSALSNTLTNDSQYFPNLMPETARDCKPNISYAPALILRKRTTRTFSHFFDQIIGQLSAGGNVPNAVKRIVEIVDEEHGFESGCADSHILCTEADEGEIYFPLHANQEQRQIVDKLRQKSGILVQGPPGTGKSHTIANLISHYLAKGLRVLVTSETPRALEVLRDKIPADIQQLCVVWLGSGKESLDSLEKSVQSITHRKANWNSNQCQHNIAQLASRLDSQRRNMAVLQQKLRACREKDVYKHDSVFGMYSGSLQQIANLVERDRESYGWLSDMPAATAKLPVTSQELIGAIQTMRQVPEDKRQKAELEVLPLESLLSTSEFSDLCEAEKYAQDKKNEWNRAVEDPLYTPLLDASVDVRQMVVKRLREILDRLAALERSYHTWVGKAAWEIAGEQDRVWRQLFERTREHITQVEKNAKLAAGMSVTGLQSNDIRKNIADVNALLAHLEAGGRLGFGPFRPKAVRQALYIIREVCIDGKECKCCETLKKLICWLSVKDHLAQIGKLWEGISELPHGDFISQFATYQDLCEPLEEAIAVHGTVKEVAQAVRQIPSIVPPRWHMQEDVRHFLEIATAAEMTHLAQRAIDAFSPLMQKLKIAMAKRKAHPLMEETLIAVRERNPQVYEVLYGQISSLLDTRLRIQHEKSVIAKFMSCAPNTCNALLNTINESHWEGRLTKIDTAWNWAQAQKWVSELAAADAIETIARALEDSAQSERNLLKELAAEKAWLECMKRLGEPERLALIAWSQAVAKIRLGKGKYAETHRETARQRLQECRKAIPAWIMPLYQVVQTVKPEPGIFDLVIVDEASQSGPEAVLLFYLANKILVVGDDKQIAPLHVGLDRQQVDYLARMHLADIPYPEALDVEGSLFGQAELRFPDRIRLREHFRCMPEIIQYCNNNFYSNEPLIPLKQYGAERLEPTIVLKHIQEGYRKGQSGNVINRPEAEAIVEAIAECCENPKYSGKTFGVISLLGNRQAQIIADLLVNELGAEEIIRRRIVCGDAYDFQGDERDVIFISLVDAPEEARGCRMIRDAPSQRRFNVAVSRAKEQLWVFHSMTLEHLRPECLRYGLLEYCKSPHMHQEAIGVIRIEDLTKLARQQDRQHVLPPPPFDSWFEVDVALRILSRGYRVIPQYNVAGYKIDLVVEGMRSRLAVECDGDEWHGPEQYEKDMARQRDLQRCQWVFCRVRGSHFYCDPDCALEPLWQKLKQLDIRPEKYWGEQEDNEARTDAHSQDTEAEVVNEDHDDDEVESVKDFNANGRKHQTNTHEKPSGRLSEALEFAKERKAKRPELLAPLTIQNGILCALRRCPGETCTVKSLAARTLRELGIITRGNPRSEFEKRLSRNVAALKRKGIVEEYKAKNRRLRLLSTQQKDLFGN
jgi:very-short-patch-repair endonuclease